MQECFARKPLARVAHGAVSGVLGGEPDQIDVPAERQQRQTPFGPAPLFSQQDRTQTDAEGPDGDPDAAGVEVVRQLVNDNRDRQDEQKHDGGQHGAPPL